MRRTVGAAIVVALAAGCGMFRDLITLQQALAREYPGESIKVTVHSDSDLAVVFQNSNYASLPDSERTAFAHGVAVFAHDHYPAASALRTIEVGFTSTKSLGPLSYTRSQSPYRFSASQLNRPPDSTRRGP
jgi:hypothetical protein